MAKIIIYLADPERDALHQLAQRKMRAPRAQAALILRRELTRLGLLPEQTQSADAEILNPQLQESQP